MHDLVAALRFDSGPPGFYVLEKPFAVVAGGSPGGDLLSRVPSLLAVLLLFFVAAPTLPRGRTRWFFALLVSASTLLNLHAAEARPYALLALLSIVLFLLSLRGDETAARLSGLVLCAAVAPYLHYLAFFVLSALLVLAGMARRWRSCAALLLASMAFLPWIPVALAQPPAALAWMRESTRGSAAGFLSALGGVGRVPAPFGPSPSRVIFLAGLAAGVLLLVLLIRSAGADREVRESVVFAVLVLGAALIAGVRRPVAFAGRTEMAVLPVWIWGISRAAAASRPLRWVAGVSALLGALTTAQVVCAPHPPAAPLEVAESLSRVARPGDLVVAAASFYLPARLAADRRRLPAGVLALPEDLARHPGWFVPSLPGGDEERLVSRAVAGVPPGGRLFVVIPPVYATPGLTGALAAPGGRTRELLRSSDALVMLRTRDPAPPAPPAPR